ncbi:MAG: HAD domain-containing protein [Merdibacter sp.]
MRPVIFLDFDGVLRPLPPRDRLCTPKQLARRFDDLRLLRVDPGMCTLYSGIDAQAMSLLAQLCSAFDAQIVLTSSWSAVYPLGRFSAALSPWHLTQRVVGSVPAGESRLSRSAPGCKRILVPAGYPWMICPWKSISPARRHDSRRA